MANILPPPDILDTDPEKLYTIGFDDKEADAAPRSKADVLQRKDLGKKLSNIVEISTEALIIALNGGWGSGKTWFLKRWVGAHGLENGGKALTVYISAFNHDYLEDPLPSIILAIDERLGKQKTKKRELLDKVKTAGSKLIIPSIKAAARISAAAFTAGLSETALNEAEKAGVKAIEENFEKAADSYWENEEGKRKSLEKFRQRLAEFAKNQPLVIVIDELDRAKPDYALSVLETIKHFFNVPHVKFILGVNLSALGKMVEHRYGLKPADALKYLERFIHFTLELPAKIQTGQGIGSNAAAYCAWALKNMGIDAKPAALFSGHIEAISQNNSVSLRDAQRLLAKFVLILSATGEREATDNFPIATETLLCLLSSELIRPELYLKLVNNQANTNDILTYYGNNNFNDSFQNLDKLYNRWTSIQRGHDPDSSAYHTPQVAYIFLKLYISGELGSFQIPPYLNNSICAAFMWIHDIPKLHAEVPHYDKLTYLEKAQSYLDLFNLNLPAETASSASAADNKADKIKVAPDE